MKWWNDIWLNEGFASYMEYKASHVVHPDWDVVCICYVCYFFKQLLFVVILIVYQDTSFIINSLQAVQYVDSKLSSHAIVKDVSDPLQITKMFDGISYSKVILFSHNVLYFFYEI